MVSRYHSAPMAASRTLQFGHHDVTFGAALDRDAAPIAEVSR